jgi:hypothetical protein
MHMSVQMGGLATEPKRRFRFPRWFLVVIGCVLFLIFVAYMWGLQTVLCLQLRSEQKSLPLLGFTPQELPSLSLNLNPGTKLSHNGYVFEVPWTDLDETKSKKFPNSSRFAFRSGYVVVVFGPNAPDKGLMTTVQKSFGSLNSDAMVQIFGPETTRSNYQFEKTLLEETPSQLKPWTNRPEAIRTSFLLLIKGIASVGGNTGIFTVQGNGWKGFQFDDPAKKPKRVAVELFDAQDRQVEILFYRGDGSFLSLTQADINRVSTTLNPAEPTNKP